MCEWGIKKHCGTERRMAIYYLTSSAMTPKKVHIFVNIQVTQLFCSTPCFTQQIFSAILHSSGWITCCFNFDGVTSKLTLVGTSLLVCPQSKKLSKHTIACQRGQLSVIQRYHCEPSEVRKYPLSSPEISLCEDV